MEGKELTEGTLRIGASFPYMVVEAIKIRSEVFEQALLFDENQRQRLNPNPLEKLLFAQGDMILQGLQEILGTRLRAADILAGPLCCLLSSLLNFFRLELTHVGEDPKLDGQFAQEERFSVLILVLLWVPHIEASLDNQAEPFHLGLEQDLVFAGLLADGAFDLVPQGQCGGFILIDANGAGGGLERIVKKVHVKSLYRDRRPQGRVGMVVHQLDMIGDEGVDLLDTGIKS